MAPKWTQTRASETDRDKLDSFGLVNDTERSQNRTVKELKTDESWFFKCSWFLQPQRKVKTIWGGKMSMGSL